MKAHLFTIVATLLVLTGCKKDTESPQMSRSVATALPFENAAVKVELVASDLPTGNVPTWVRAMTFLDASVGIVSTYDGKVYRTSNGGRNWTLQYSVGTSTQLPLLQILFTSARVGYIVGGSFMCAGTGCTPPGGLVLKTTDAGITWTAVYRVSGAVIASLAVNSVGDLFAVANTSGSQVLKSSDAGATWTPVASWPYQLNKLAFDRNRGYGASGNSGTGNSSGKIVRSLDDGASWSEAATFTYPYLNELAFSTGTGFFASGYSTVYKTTNDGANWTPIPNSGFSAQVIAPLTATRCLIFGGGTYSGGDFGTYSGSLRQSEDAGNSWSEIELKTVNTIYQASFYNTQNGYALAGNTLLKITVK